MTTISKLSAIETLSAGDLLAIFDSSNGDARKASLSKLSSYIVDNIEDTLSLIKNVKDYGAEGTGLVDDTTELTSAVEAAYNDGSLLYWPYGSYLTTSSIPHLHDVMSFGEGQIIRGSDTFYISPEITESNEVYVSTTGSDTDDGLSNTEPFKTIDHAYDVIRNKPFGGGAWKINLAAGTYTAGVTIDHGMESRGRTEIIGPDVGGHPNVPTAIIDMATNASGRGIEVDNNNQLLVNQVKIINATSGTAFVVNRAKISLVNCHTYNCKFVISVLNSAHVACNNGGIWDGNNIADSIGYRSFYNSTHDFVQSSNDATTDALLIKNFARGMLINEGVQGHVDNVNILDCTTGLNIKRGAGAINTNTMRIDGCTTAWLAENNAWYDNGIIFGGLSANTVNVRALGGSPELIFLTSSNAARTERVLETTKAAAHTGTTNQTTLYTSITMRDWAVSQGGHSAEIMIAGTASLAAGTCGARIYLNDGSSRDQLAVLSIPNGTTDFRLAVDVFNDSASTQRCIMQLNATPTATVVDYSTGALTLTDKEFTLEADFNLSDAGDSITLAMIKFSATYGG